MQCSIKCDYIGGITHRELNPAKKVSVDVCENEFIKVKTFSIFTKSVNKIGEISCIQQNKMLTKLSVFSV